jgi:DNA modification methylase
MPNLARDVSALPYGTRSIITDKPIDYSIPYRARAKGAARHYGFFPFFAKKPWQVIQEYINHYTSPGDLVGDPFSGSGVTAVEALILGRRAVASDINPVARFITRMTAVSPVNLEALREAFEFVRSQCQDPIESLQSMTDAEVVHLLERLDYPRTPIPATVRRPGAETIDQMHTPRQLAGLTLLRDAISLVPDALLRDLLLVALAATVRYANRTYGVPVSRSPYRGNAGFLRRFSYSFAGARSFYEHRVWPTFDRSYGNVVEAKNETNRLIGRRYTASFNLSDLSASHFHELTGDGTLDYCFTDPPYSNDIYFVDLSTLWAAWLGFEITDEIRRNELIEGGIERKTREQFENEFGAAMESVAKALKEDHWFTLVYKHKDLSLWQNIVAACERSGLRYVNSVWQDVKIISTRQIECPKINPKGDMYLNFRKMSQRTFAVTYPRAEVIDLPTIPNYLTKEVERLIVSYLGADITLITSGVIQQTLDSRAFRGYRENPASLEQDITKTVGESSHFTTWQLNNKPLWLLSPGSPVESTLPAIDRARYYVFDFLRGQREVSEADVSTHLLSRFAAEPDAGLVTQDVPALLRQVGRQVAAHQWQFDEDKVTRYKQLRLFFQRASLDEMRDNIQARTASSDIPLRPNYEGLALLYERLHSANGGVREFEQLWSRLLTVLKIASQRLVDYFESDIEKVLAVGDWAQHGVDLRNAPFEDLFLQIVLRSEDRSFSKSQEIAGRAFGNLDDDELLLQFDLMTPSEWKHALQLARLGQENDLGVSVLDRI